MTHRTSRIVKDCVSEAGYLLFVGRTRRMTQYADTAVSDIDPDGILRFA
ncbi:MAG: hypothetical protein J6V80_05430 [Clostridia bacterium]|nr:hypothetical protein [Clostridia bacterium]